MERLAKLLEKWRSLRAGLAIVLLLLPYQALWAAACTLDNSPDPYVRNDVTSNAGTSLSYCELCGYGYVTYVVSNPLQQASLTNTQVVVDLGSSGLVYEPTAPTPVTYSVNGGPAFAGTAPSGAGSVLTFNLPDVAPVNGNSAGTLTVKFAVRRASNPESLVSASRSYSTRLTFTPNPSDFSCNGIGGPYTDTDVLPLREPVPQISKRGYNYDAGQRNGSASTTVYGNNNDDIVWRIRIANNGLADLQDLRFDDFMTAGNMVVNYACPTRNAADAVAANNGVLPGSSPCVAASNSVNDFVVTNPFGQHSVKNYPWGSSAEVDVAAGGNTSIYLVGKITANGSCITSQTNTVSDLQWGCDAQPGAGGISMTSSGTTPSDATARLVTLYRDGGRSALQVNRQLTGVNTSQPVGSRGTMTITLTNHSGGSVKFSDGLAYHLKDQLPAEYVVDPTFTPTISVNSSYGNYAGRINTITWTNPVAGTFPLTTTNPLVPLGNTTPEFKLSSGTSVHPLYSDQKNMMRQGDVATIRFRVVLIKSSYYDRAANLDITPETNTVADKNTDPDPGGQIMLSNTLDVQFDTFCSSDGTQHFTLYGNGTGNPGSNNNIPANPEDLDISIGGTVFILTNDTNQLLTLPVLVTNHGGHDARDYHVFVTFGATMDIANVPSGCSVVSPLSGSPPQPDPFKVWVNPPSNPIPIPSTATVYECTSSSAIAPGQTVTYNFDVRKTTDPTRLAIDDLTFRADVLGEITLYDGTPLWFPAPIIRTDNQTDRANNYSLDTVWARVVGFNLIKNQYGVCSENNPPTLDSNNHEEVQIGEECAFHIETGGWFGFKTPGFAYIAVQNIDVVDEVPNGQAYISSTDPSYNAADTANTSTSLITGISLNPAGLSALTEGNFDWKFNVPDSQQIKVADEWFRANVTTRVLNKPINSSAAPNMHAADSANVLNSTFDATFSNLNTGATEVYGLGPTTVGYPNEPIRRVDLTVTEPNITVVKEVCNETLYGTGTGCTNFKTLTNEGDTQDSYIYRVKITNEASASNVTRAPAYDLTSTDTLDASDLVYVEPFDNDGLDNDGDGLIDGADTDGESSISDNTVNNGIRPVITNSYTNSQALLQINPGTTVTFYYRVDPDDRVAPAQQLVNTISATYDSLYGDYGNQTVVQSANGTLGGARVYNTTPVTATIEILALLTQPKTIINLSNTAISASQPQPVSIGEEMQYELRAKIPVANLRQFYIRDELPAGISCSEAPVVDLDAPPYDAAGFVPGGKITPTCTNNLVEWNFGDQWLTTAPDATQRFDFYVRFIARVDNSVVTNSGVTISNGVPATNTILHYVNDANADVVLNFAHNDILVQEPKVVLTKTFEVNSTDAGDIITVTVTAQNTGTGPAYNLHILDDLTGKDLTYVGPPGGSNPPDSVDTATFGANAPLFIWNTLAAGATYSFTFDISVDTAAQPYEVLDNTIYASWTSLPSQNTALNSTGAIGADGSATGMRIGTIPPGGDAINDYEASAATSATVPPLTMTKTDLDPAVLPEIGAHKHFRIDINLPEGTTHNLTVSDNLAFGGQSYLLENNTTYDVTYTFQGIASINGQAPSESALTAFPADSSLNTALWNIGTVVTDTEDDTSGTPAINPMIRIDYYVRINNDLTTDAGDVVQNSADVTYTNGENGTTQTLNANTTAYTVIEPQLAVTKTVSPMGPVNGGDILTYTVTVTNSGTGTAYDVNIKDSLPAELALYSSYTPTATINGTAVSGFVATPAGAPNGPLIWGQGNGDGSLDVPAAGTLVLTYQTIVQSAQANASFSNYVVVDWTSLDGASAYERTGAGCPNITAPNDYCAGPVSATNSTNDTNSFTKTVVADTYTDAPSNATDGIVRVGDLVTFRLALNLQPGITRSVKVTDVLPTGLELYDIVSINGDTDADGNGEYDPPASGAGSNFSYVTVTAASLPTAGQTGTLSFTLGDVYNNPLGDPTTDTLVILYRAKVPTDVLPHVASTTLTNTATLSYVDYGGNPVVDPSRLQSSATVTVWQPIIDPITKVDRLGRTSVLTVNLASDTMYFRVEACNTTGQAPAYSLLFNDVLASEFNEASISGPTNGLGQPDVTINGTLGTTGTDYVYTPPAGRGGTMSILLKTPVNPGQCVQIDYNIGFHTDLSGTQVWNNSATLNEYWSLPDSSGQRYGPLGPATFTMTNGVINIDPPTKTLYSPASGEATIGEEVVYRITVPGTASNAALYDVVINDTLNSALEYVSATDVSGNAFAITDNSVAPGTVSLSIAQIPAGKQAVVELHARVANNSAANAGVSFINTASYNYATSTGGAVNNGGSATSTAVTIIEPRLALNKTVSNITNPGNAPDAGDILRYTLTLTASGGAVGDNYTNAFDVSLDDNLSLGLVYRAGTATVDGTGNTIIDPTVSGDGATTAQNLNWNLADATANIDVAEGTTVTVTYEVQVVDIVKPVTSLTNSVTAQWTSLDGASTYERNGSGTPAENDYFTTAATSIISHDIAVAKIRLTDTYGAADANVRIGDIVEYELRLSLPEGTIPGVTITDTLPRGLQFESVVSVNGQSMAPYAQVAPFTYNDIAAPVFSGDPVTGPSTVTWTVDDVVNASDNTAANNDFVIVYYARVLDNALPQTASSALTNTAKVDYVGGSSALSKTASNTVTLQQPVLAVTKTAAPANGDTVLDAAELVTYTVDIKNNGASPAYDTLLTDTIPLGMRNGAATITMISTTLVNASLTLPNVTPLYDAATGLATWNFDSGTADQYSIPAGDTLRIVYRVQADADLGAGMTLTNQATAQRYYSFDNNDVPTLGGITGVAQIYGPSNTASVTLTTAPAPALDKQNTQLTATIGEQFAYRIVVPVTPLTTDLHDVRILDDLSASAADMSFVSVTKISGTLPWTPVNTGTDKNLVIEDTTDGIDIPAGQQIEIEITVVLNDSTTNVAGLKFHNTATYTYNRYNNDNSTQGNGMPDTTADMTIVEPDKLTLQKSGPPQMRIGTPGTFTLNVHNTGTSTAWDLTITDQIPNANPGGMCDTLPPYNFTAQLYQADGTTAVGSPLVENTDFKVNLVTGTPVCTLTVTMMTPAAAIPADERLIVTYDVGLDTDTPPNSTLTNIAGATQWYSLDTAGAGATGQIRTYTRTLSDGTPTVLDFQDAYSVLTETPIIALQKYVVNVTSGQDPGSNAYPGDTLRYRIVATNVSPAPVYNFSIVDEVDRLNPTALFVPGSLNIISVPAGADTTNTNASGGSQGTGLLDVRQLNLDAQGGATDSITIEFEVKLIPVINSGTYAYNQAQLLINNLAAIVSDDPNVNGADDPKVPGGEDPTQTLIMSSPKFQIYKISDDITGSPTLLLPGDTLRYTLTVKNIGNENAINAILRDQIPANTTYVADSTTLNGMAVADPTMGMSPLQNGLLIYAPEDPTPGAMRADADAAVTTNMATITFDVTINADVINGTVISNQGYLTADGAGSGPIDEKRSDDPNTPIPDDPTLDVVGNLPLIDAVKTVAIETDGGTLGVVDPGDVLRYTIVITNYGKVAASGVKLVDAIPANTTYFPNSVFLNNLPVGNPDGGVSPLIAGIPVSSSDLTPPVPEVGYLSPGGSATVTFWVTVNAGTAPGTVISNQGFVYSKEQAVEPTDADGNDANGDQPTLIVVGNAQALAINKQVSVVGGGAALAGSQLEYVVQVSNISTVPAYNVLITDNLDEVTPGYMSYVTGSATLNGATLGVTYDAPTTTLSADYGSNYSYLQPGQTAVLRFRVQLDANLAIGTTVTNKAWVYWENMTKNASASVSIDIGGTPGTANLNGRVWHDENFNNTYDSTERSLADWTVEIYFKNKLLDTVTTDANGAYHVVGLAPNYVGPDHYELRYVAPGTGANTAKLGTASSTFTNGLQSVRDIIVYSGNNLQNVDLPITPNGVVYNSLVRVPVSGATVTLLNASSNQPLPSNCFDDAAQQNQVTLDYGYYKFNLNFSQAECPSGVDYVIRVTPPSTEYVSGESVAIPAQSDASSSAFSVPNCIGGVTDAVPATADYCEAQTFATVPPLSIKARAAQTDYYLKLTLANGTPGQSQLFNNPIPVDPQLGSAVAISKTSPKVNVSRGELVPYTIVVHNTMVVPLSDVSIIDDFPAGFKYVKGSARINDVPTEPTISGLQMRWTTTIGVEATTTIKLLLVVGAGVQEGEYVNRAHVYDPLTQSNASGEASATVRVVPDPTFDCSDILGKVFDDKNLNGHQDKGEPGLVGVRLATARGLLITTDAHGRFHVTCAAVPNEQRGSTISIKLDERSLPSGFRLTTENPRVQKVTRGKAINYNFGATVHRVVTLDLADGVFEPNSTEMRAQWAPRLGLLIQELRKAPSVLRLTYLADVEPESIVKARLKALKNRLKQHWKEINRYQLSIETEVFWRHGGPVSQGGRNQ